MLTLRKILKFLTGLLLFTDHRTIATVLTPLDLSSIDTCPKSQFTYAKLQHETCLNADLLRVEVYAHHKAVLEKGENSVSTYTTAIHLLKAIPDREKTNLDWLQQSHLESRICFFLTSMNPPAKTRACYSQAMVTLNHIEDANSLDSYWLRQANLYKGIALTFAEEKNWQQSGLYLGKALASLNKTPEKLKNLLHWLAYADYYCSLAATLLFVQNPNFPKAIGYLLQAVGLLQQHAPTTTTSQQDLSLYWRALMTTQNQLAEVYYLTNDFTNALNSDKQTLKYFDNIPLLQRSTDDFQTLKETEQRLAQLENLATKPQGKKITNSR